MENIQGHPLSILILTDIFFPDAPGGANRMVYYVSRGLADAGHRVRVLTNRPRPDLPSRELFGRLDVRRYDLFPPKGTGSIRGAIRAVRTIRRACDELVRETPVDVVSVHQPLPGFAATLSRGLQGFPFSYGFYSPWHEEYEFKVKVLGPRNPLLRCTGWYALSSRVRRAFEHRAVMRSRNAVVLSEFSRRLLGRVHGFPAERVIRIPGGVDERRYAPMQDRRESRRKLGLPEDRILLFTVRNLRPRMGIGNLIDAMVRVAREAPSAFLLIGGAGALKAELEARARRLGLEERVRFCGYVAEDDLPAYYNAADFFVLPTEYLEGFGMVTLEALSCGTPVLGTPVGATPEVLKPLDESLLFPDASPDGMAASIIRHVRAIESDPAGYQPSRERCVRYVHEGFAWGRLTARWAEALRAAAGEGR